MAVAIIAAMTFVVVDEVYDFLGENVVWIVITVGVSHKPATHAWDVHVHVPYVNLSLQQYPCAVVAFSPTVGAALNSAGVGVLGSILGAALGLLIIVLVAALAAGFSYQSHPVTMVGTRASPALHACHCCSK